MQREGSPWKGLWTVVSKETADHLTSARMRFLEFLIVAAALGSVFAATGHIKSTIGKDPFLFLTLFTTAKEPFPSFVVFIGFLIPIAAIALGFDAINSEHNNRTLSRIVAQPIYRDVLLFGKFLAALLTLAILLLVLWLSVMGLGMIMLGLPPSGEEVIRSFTFLLAALCFGGVWLALAMLFSVLFRQPATSALASLAVWLFFVVFWSIIAEVAADALYDKSLNPIAAAVDKVELKSAISRFSPNHLFGELTVAILNPATRSFGAFLFSQMQGAIIGAPIPFAQSVLLVWPHFTALIAGTVLMFTLTYVIFQRQEIRA